MLMKMDQEWKIEEMKTNDIKTFKTIHRTKW